MFTKKRILPLVGLLMFLMNVNGQTTSKNFVKTSVYLDESGTSKTDQVQYYDHWGRPSQSASQGVGTKVLFQQIEYDALGRQSRIWNAVPQDGLGFDYNFIAHSQNALGSNAYVRTSYDAIGRTTSTSLPGASFSSCTTSYSFNQAPIKKYNASPHGGGLQQSGTYPVGQLHCVTNIDADGHIVRSYSNDEGRTLLERRGTNNDTYYVYDELGLLCYVLPPMMQDLPAADTSLFFRYYYDDRGRCINKKLPGCANITYTYNDADLLTTEQDGELRAVGKVRHYTYDTFHRLKCVYLKATGTNAQEIEITNYYDNDTFIDSLSISTSQRNHLRANGLFCQEGMMTGVCQRASNGEYIYTAYYYDAKRRLAEERCIMLSGIETSKAYSYSFSGELLSCVFEYRRRNGSETTILLSGSKNYQYEAAPSQQLHSITLTLTDSQGNESTRDIATYQYSNYGHISTLDRGSAAATVHYVYDNVRGWLTGMSTQSGFRHNVFRENSNGVTHYMGSLSRMGVKLPDSDIVHNYRYGYDNLQRLTHAYYYSYIGDGSLDQQSSGIDLISLIPTAPLSSISDGNQYSCHYEYDKNSNITSISRRGMDNTRSYGVIDSLSITRTGNQLKKVDDLSGRSLTYIGASDFIDGASTAIEYSYNANGALIMDKNREITSIIYDSYNNPRQITFNNTNKIQYVYSADGRKLRTKHKTHPILQMQNAAASTTAAGDIGIIGPPSLANYSDSTEYIDNLILENRVPSKFLFEGGYASLSSSGGVTGWHYYIRDYMGNVRMVVNENGTTEQETYYYPYGGVIGDISTNQNLQKYKFEGKELDRRYGLDWYDIHARQYDAIGVPSWNKVDALAEKYYHLSPYVFAGGNPVNFGDYNGEKLYIIDSDGNKIHYQTNSDDDFVKNVQSFISDFCSNGGEDIIYALDRANYDISYDRDDYGGSSSFTHGETKAEGRIHLSIWDKKKTPNTKDGAYAHETFHAFQYVNNQNPSTIASEIEAIIFGAKYTYDKWGLPNYPATVPISNNSYVNSIESLVMDGFSSELFSEAFSGFFEFGGTATSIYENIPLGIPNLNNNLLTKTKFFK